MGVDLNNMKLLSILKFLLCAWFALPLVRVHLREMNLRVLGSINSAPYSNPLLDLTGINWLIPRSLLQENIKLKEDENQREQMS